MDSTDADTMSKDDCKYESNDFNEDDFEQHSMGINIDIVQEFKKKDDDFLDEEGIHTHFIVYKPIVTKEIE